MDTTRLISRLTHLGLTTYEARAYAALIRRESFTAAQVARQADLPRQRIYDVLGSLVGKGLASGRPGATVKYAAVAPELAIERLMSAQRERMAELERDATSILDSLTPEYEAGRAHTDPLEYIEVLRDASAINRRFADLQANVKREILVFTKPPFARPPQENVEGIEVARTHAARSVYELDVLDNEAMARGIKRFIDAGEEARFVEHVPLKLVIIDEATVLFGMQDPMAGAEDLTIMVVEHPALAQTLKLAFNRVWDRGLEFDEAMERHRVAKEHHRVAKEHHREALGRPA